MLLTEFLCLIKSFKNQEDKPQKKGGLLSKKVLNDCFNSNFIFDFFMDIYLYFLLKKSFTFYKNKSIIINKKRLGNSPEPDC